MCSLSIWGLHSMIGSCGEDGVKETRCLHHIFSLLLCPRAVSSICLLFIFFYNKFPMFEFLRAMVKRAFCEWNEQINMLVCAGVLVPKGTLPKTSEKNQ